MLSAQFADSSIDPLWSNQDRRMKKSVFALEIQELDFGDGGCRELKERHLINSCISLVTWHLSPNFHRRPTHQQANKHRTCCSMCRTGGEGSESDTGT